MLLILKLAVNAFKWLWQRRVQAVLVLCTVSLIRASSLLPLDAA
jgi:hypothetical protein